MPAKKSNTLKDDINLLFQRLLVAKDISNILSHEITRVPLALADTVGNLRPTNKAALGKILERGVSAEVLPVSALKTCSIIDGQTLVQAIGKPYGAKSFGDIADAFNTYVFSHFNQNCPSVDVESCTTRRPSSLVGGQNERGVCVQSVARFTAEAFHYLQTGRSSWTCLKTKQISHTFSALN